MDLLRVHSQDLHEHIAQEVGECLESGLYTDLAIRCAGGQTLHAHRLVMAAVSPYLQMVIIHFRNNIEIVPIFLKYFFFFQFPKYVTPHSYYIPAVGNE